jgi:hypothetical protein
MALELEIEPSTKETEDHDRMSALAYLRLSLDRALRHLDKLEQPAESRRTTVEQLIFLTANIDVAEGLVRQICVDDSGIVRNSLAA